MAAPGFNVMDLMRTQLILQQRENYVTGLILLTVFEFLTGFFRESMPAIMERVKRYFTDNFQKHMPDVVSPFAPPKVAELAFERDYTRTDNWDRADAILATVLKIPDAQELLVLGSLELIKNTNTFQIAPGIDFTLHTFSNETDSGKGGIRKISFKLTSTTQTVCELRKFADQMVEDYLVAKKNNLGSKLFYFDQIVDRTTSMGGSGMDSSSASKRVVFSKHLFVTNRNLDNVFHERQQELRDRVDFFLNRKNWYDSRGIPHTLGLMFHGEKGCGKTSSIKAIANESQRHILNVNLGAIKSASQLKKLFYDDRITICENPDSPNNTTDYIIPINRRIYVLEDIDAASQDFLLKRSYQKSSDTDSLNRDPDVVENPLAPKGGLEFRSRAESSKSDIDLSTVLNILDGTLEVPGRILIITTNYPEKLDEALIRPGRIDLLLEFKKCNHAVIQDMFRAFFHDGSEVSTTTPTPKGDSYEIDAVDLALIKEYAWTPAEVAQILFKNFGNPQNAIIDLQTIDPTKHFKIADPNEAESTVTLIGDADSDSGSDGDTKVAEPINDSADNTNTTMLEPIASVISESTSETTEMSDNDNNDNNDNNETVEQTVSHGSHGSPDSPDSPDSPAVIVDKLILTPEEAEKLQQSVILDGGDSGNGGDITSVEVKGRLAQLEDSTKKHFETPANLMFQMSAMDSNGVLRAEDEEIERSRMLPPEFQHLLQMRSSDIDRFINDVPDQIIPLGSMSGYQQSGISAGFGGM